MIERLRLQPWVDLADRVGRRNRSIRIIVRWREAPPDYNSVNLLLEYILRTMFGR